nr:MAG: hypothetical protein [Bacteriophage sp.]
MIRTLDLLIPNQALYQAELHGVFIIWWPWVELNHRLAIMSRLLEPSSYRAMVLMAGLEPATY